MPLKIVVMRGILFLLFAGAGLAMARLAVIAIRRRLEWKRDGVAVEGEIVAFEERASTDASDRRPLFAPVVTFRIAGGEMRRFKSGRSVRPNPWVVGQKVPVRYMRSDPADVELEEVTRGLLPILALLAFAIVFLGVSLLPILMPAPTSR
ncbi:MAG: DUF3592 domain-containing protein [Acidobacteriota bacterium]